MIQEDVDIWMVPKILNCRRSHIVCHPEAACERPLNGPLMVNGKGLVSLHTGLVVSRELWG